jgi:hypothetical protein
LARLDGWWGSWWSGGDHNDKGVNIVDEFGPAHCILLHILGFVCLWEQFLNVSSGCHMFYIESILVESKK